MASWLQEYLRARIAYALRDERGQSEFLIVALLVFIIFIILSGRRLVVQ
jgi:hypothetical protein